MTLSTRLRAAAIAVLAAAAMGGGIATAPAASAAPSDCVRYSSKPGVWVKCYSGSGSYQAYAVCRQSYWPYYHAFMEGPWRSVGSGSYSWAYCYNYWQVVSSGVGLRNY